MSILGRIECKVFEFEEVRPRRAGRVLVGKAEFVEIRKEAEAMGYYQLRGGARGIMRAEVMGLKIYEMDDDSYLEVAL